MTTRGQTVGESSDEPHEGSSGVAREAAQRYEAGNRRDKAALERDDAAEQRDEAAALRDAVGNLRDDVAETRDDTGEFRDRGARDRDATAVHRDLAAEQRDRLAEGRDRAAVASETPDGPTSRSTGHNARAAAASELARRDASSDRGHSARDRLAGAAERSQARDDRDSARADRGSGATERGDAGADRDSAHTDRDAGADQRAQAVDDRDTSSADRDSSASDLAVALLDGLTGVYARGAGLLALQREMERSRRTGQPLALTFFDVDGLKAINDSGGHAAGDRVLVKVARALTASLRPYDLVIRYGGDEFLCAFADASALDVAARVQGVNAILTAGPMPTTASVGLADMRPDDTLESLIGRADDDLYRRRRLI